jgi:hypothetical protein
MSGESEQSLKVVEPTDAKRAFAEDEQRPAVTDHRDGAGQ